MIYFVPELYTLFAAGVFFVLSLVKDARRRDFNLAVGLSALGILICLVWLGAQGLIFSGTYQVDTFSQVFKCLIYMGLFLVVSLCGNLAGVDSSRHSEFYFLLF